MKKYFFTAAIIALVAACSNNTGNGGGADTTATASEATDLNSNPDYQKGLNLVASNDCLTCHKVDEKVTGPAYREVANKYADNDDNIKMLANKVIAGGSGVWGDAAMTPHPMLSQDDAQQMVKYILLLRNK